MSVEQDAGRAHILVVDDEPFSLDFVSDVLGERYALTTLQDGQSAMRMLEEAGERFDLVILDRRMAEPDGMSLLRFMRGSPTLARTPVILQTAAADPVQIAEGIEAGADYYLTKPFRMSALTTLVRAALKQSRERETLHAHAHGMEGALALLGEAVFRLRTLDDVAALAQGLSGLCADPDLVRVGLSELLMNAVEHGNLGLGFEAKGALLRAGQWHDEIERRLNDPLYRGRMASLNVSVSAQDVRFVITDEGEGFDWAPYLEMPTLHGSHINGRGIALARQLAFASLVYRQDGRVVEVTATPKPRLRG